MPKMTPERMVKKVLKITKDWRFHAISIGYPGVVERGEITVEPRNLGPGWVIRFRVHPVKLINDAAMQALGAYRGGSMLLGLGTGLGTTLIVHGVIAPMELSYRHGHSYEDHVSKRARKRRGNKQWRRDSSRFWKICARPCCPTTS